MIYVTLPPDFIAIKYPGYFWNLKEQKLYSLKQGGVLTPLKLTTYYINFKSLKARKKYRFISYDKHGAPCYHLSVKGKRRTVFESKLKELEPTFSQMKVMVNL